MKRELAKLVGDGLYTEALSLFSNHHSRSFLPNKFTFPSLLKACTKLKSISQGQILHTHIIKTGFYRDTYAATSLTSMYMKFHLLPYALQLLDEMPQPNTTSFNVAISGCFHNGCYEEALGVFRVVCNRGLVRSDSVTIACALRACGNARQGRQVHCLAFKIGVEADIYAATSLVTMYFSCADVVSAVLAFEQTNDKNVACYNAFLTGLLQNGVAHVVLNEFKSMKGSSGEPPNPVTYVSVLSACSELKFIEFGRQVHGMIAKVNLQTDTLAGTSLLDMYCKCRKWPSAYAVFQELNGRRSLITWNSMIAGTMLNDKSENAIELFMQLELEGLKPDSATWNSMISGFSQLGKDIEAILFFRKMQSAGVIPSMKSVTSILPACSSMSALQSGKEIHGYVIRTGINKDEFIATAVIDMYMKCGKSSLAQHVFDQFAIKPNDPVIWNAMISGYGRNGQAESAFNIFEQMQREHVRPNSSTFNCILTVCSHAGEVEKGLETFTSLMVDYGVIPTLEHFNCMIDILARSGRLDDARELLRKIPESSPSVIASLLGASKFYSNLKLGEEMAKTLEELEPENPLPFVILSNIYAAQGRWEDVEAMREVINQRGLNKLPGFSSVGM